MKSKNITKEKLEEFISNLSGKKYLKLCEEYDIDPFDGNEMQQFIESTSSHERNDIINQYT